MIKFQATYRVTIYTQTETITVEYPLTCKFNVTRGTFSESAKATISLYNLAPATREKIFQDCFTVDESQWKYVHLEAGYNNSLSLIFKGRILQAYSSRSGGQTDVITEIQAQAFDVFDCQSSYYFAEGTTYKDAYNIMASDMPNVTIGNTGNIEGTFLTPTTFDGNTHEQLNKLTGGHTFVDNGVLNTIMDNEVIDVPVSVIDDTNGLLDTPRRRDANLEITILFEPTLIVGQLLEIKSNVSPNFNGQYKVLGFTHDCLISASQAGTRTTQVSLWIGPLLPGADVALSQNPDAGFNKVKGDKISVVNEQQPSAVREVYRYIQKNNGKIPSTQITKSISWKDMIGNNNTDAERVSQCTLAVLTNVYNTAKTMQNVLNKYYPGQKIKINSGWRSTRNNSACKGKPTSKHLYGLAIDFSINGVTPYNVYNLMSRVWSGWVGRYATFTHVQINSTKGKANDR